MANRSQHEYKLKDPKIAAFLFSDTRMAIVWLVARLYLGWQWLDAGRHKVLDDGWMDGGTALKGFWERIVAVPEQGQPAITYGWYRDFIQFMLDSEWYTWFARVVAVGEVLIGVSLILGLFTGIAALLGASLNFNFMLAGTASTNPVLFLIALGLILAWKIEGYFGLDAFVLPRIGTPWKAGFAWPHRRNESTSEGNKKLSNATGTK